MNQELIKQARQANLINYLVSKNFPLKRVGKNYVSKEHSSLYIYENKFVWYSKDKKGNSVDFLQLFYGMDFKTAVSKLTGQQHKLIGNERRVLAYLCKKRGIKSDIVIPLINRGLISQDSRGNCNFLIRDWDEQPIGFEIVGTGDTRFKQITTHSSYGFHLTFGNVNDVLFFESAIDLLSFYQIYQNKITHHALVSMGGLNPSFINEVISLSSNLRIWLCVDNDQAGFNFINNIKSSFHSAQVLIPKNFKDWNELLLNRNI